MLNCEVNGILSIQDSPHFQNLKYLNMGRSTLNISFLQIVGLMPSLEFLSLYNCGLEGILSHQGLCELVHPKELYLEFVFCKFDFSSSTRYLFQSIYWKHLLVSSNSSDIHPSTRTFK